MLEIENAEMKIIVSVSDIIKNSDDFLFYSKCFKLLITFVSKSINYEATWECYTGEIEEFKSGLINLTRSEKCDEVVFSPMLETGKLVIEKIIKPYETYCFKFILPSTVNSPISVQGMTMLDQSYMPDIITKLEELTRLYS